MNGVTLTISSQKQSPLNITRTKKQIPKNRFDVYRASGEKFRGSQTNYIMEAEEESDWLQRLCLQAGNRTTIDISFFLCKFSIDFFDAKLRRVCPSILEVVY